MKKLLFALLPAALLLGACNTPLASSTSEASESVSEEPSSSASVVEDTSSSEVVATTSEVVTSSSEEEGIPTITPTLVLTVAETTPVEDENTVYVASEYFEEVGWTGKAATKNEDGTWQITFAETEVDLAISYRVFICNTEAGFNETFPADECGDNKSLSFVVTEGQETYSQTVTFTKQPSTSAMHEEVTVTITVKDSNNEAVPDYCYLWVYDSFTGATNLWTSLGEGAFSYVFKNVSYGTGLDMNGTLNNSSESDGGWPCEWNARVYIEVTADTATYTANASVPADKIPADPATTTYHTVNYIVVLPADLGYTVNIKLQDGANWYAMTGNGADTYTLTRSEIEGTINFCVCSWFDGADQFIYADASGTHFSYECTEDMSVTVTGDFSTHVGTMTTGEPLSFAAVTFNYTATEEILSGQSVQIVDSAESNWNAMTLIDGVWTVTLNLELNEVYSFRVYTWNNGNLNIYADAEGTFFSITPTGDCTVTIEGTFASGVGTITVA